MIDDLFRLLKKPELWRRNSEPFWDDDHISKSMLEAHLNPEWDAASRKRSFIDDSVQWLSSLIPAGSKILDIGCGPGLYTKRLSDMGYRVTGMDYSRRSIAYAKSQDHKTEYICQNYLNLDYSETFDAITLIYCDYAALIPDERKILLDKVYKALKPGGLFIFDINTSKYFANLSEKTSWSLNEDGGFWSSKPHIWLEATYLYDNNTISVDQYIVITSDTVKEYLIWFTEYSIEKLRDEASPFGFRIKGVYDDVCGSSYSGEGEEICFVLEKPGGDTY